MKFKYDFCIDFYKEIDLNKFEEDISIKASKLYERLFVVKGHTHDRGCQTYSLYSETFEDVYIEKHFHSFLLEISENVINVMKIIQEYNGKCHICVVLESKDFSSIGVYFSPEDINILDKMNCGLDFDVGLF